jgi:hypothetical protein
VTGMERPRRQISRRDDPGERCQHCGRMVAKGKQQILKSMVDPGCMVNSFFPVRFFLSLAR